MIGIKDQAFGMELEFSGITRREAAHAIAKVINGNTNYVYDGGVYNRCTVTDGTGRKWQIVRDASITETGNGEACEFVTPKCTYKDMETVQECIRAIRRAGGKVNTSCGLHVHVDAGNHTAQSLKNLAFTMKAKQNLLYKAVGTQHSRLGQWCKPIDDKLIDSIKHIKKLDTENIKSTWYGTYTDDCGRDETDHYHYSRYHALNLHSVWFRGTVEFRFFEATLHAGEVRSYITLCLAMSAAAINSKRANDKELGDGSEKYAMRTWINHIGLKGDEWKTVRQHLLKKLEGNPYRRYAEDVLPNPRRSA